MSARLTSGMNTIDPLTGIPVTLGFVRITQDGSIRVTQTTGEPPYGTNQLPGTDINVPGSAQHMPRVTQTDLTRITQVDDVRVVSQLGASDDIGKPYGFLEIPETGPLT